MCCKEKNKVVFMGTPEFAAISLEHLIKNGYNVVAVVTQPDKQKNRGKKVVFSPVKELALTYNIPVLQPEKVKGNIEFYNELKSFEPDVIVVTAYGKLPPKEILDLPHCGCINVHGSLLPKLRGASPIQCAILEGMEETGITLMKMDEGMDTGNMINKAKVKVENMDFQQLHDALATAGGKLLVDNLESILDGSAAEDVQDESEATYSFMISKEDGHLNFKDKSGEELERTVRAFSQWPGTYFYHNDQMVKVKEAEPGVKCQGEPGQVVALSKDGIKVACNDSSILLKTVQPAGKKPMDAWSYLMGNKMEVGKVLR